MTTANPLEALLADKGVLMADGATGTNLFAMGLEAGEAPELWNESKPENITKLHQDFVDAGADIILTNSFGGTRHRLKLHKAEGRVFELNKKLPAPSPTRPTARSSLPAPSARPANSSFRWAP